MHKKTEFLIFFALQILGSNVAYAQSLFWQQMNLDTTDVRSMASNPQGDIFAANWSNNLYRSTNDGRDWTELDPGHAPLTCLLADLQGEVFAGSDSGVYYSSDNGDHWRKQSSLYLVEALITPDGGKTFLAGAYDGVSRSSDTCKTWVRLTPDGTGYLDCLSLAITREGSILGARIPAGGYSGMIRSTDNGQTWTHQEPWGSGYVNEFLIPPKGDIFYVGKYGLFRSTDDGQSWGWSADTLPPDVTFELMNTLTIDSSSVIYAGTGYCNCPGGGVGGVYRSTNNGRNWKEWNSGLTKGIEELIVNAHGYLFAGGHGVFRSVNPVTGVSVKNPENSNVPTALSLSQNYPNPFNPASVIRYTLAEDGRVSLKVFDVFGQEVRTLLDEVQSSGFKEVTFDANSLPSGVYFYRLQAGSFVEVKKMILMR